VRTESSHTNLVKLSVIREKKRRALSPYGPVKVGLTTSQTTPQAQLTELLNSLESVVESLNYKSFTVYDTLLTATENLRVALSNIATEEDGTDTL
jgi:hypothetical protein